MRGPKRVLNEFWCVAPREDESQIAAGLRELLEELIEPDDGGGDKP